MIELSVVIPTCNRGATLDRCLEHLTHQTVAPDRFEVIVADDASSDDTGSRLERWARDSRLEVRPAPGEKAYAGGARNRGAAMARAARILFLGDDILATPELVERHLEGGAAAPGAVLVGEVAYHPTEPTTPFMRWMEDDGVHHDFPRLRRAAAEGRSVAGRYFYACNASVPADALRATGGFDESIRRAWEDTELGVRLERAGYPLRFLPGITGWHVHPIDLRGYVDFLRRGREDVVAALAALETHGEGMPQVVPHPILDRIVTDGTIAGVARVIDAAAAFIPDAARRRLYRRVLRYERRRAFLARTTPGSAGGGRT